MRWTVKCVWSSELRTCTCTCSWTCAQTNNSTAHVTHERMHMCAGITEARPRDRDRAARGGVGVGNPRGLYTGRTRLARGSARGSARGRGSPRRGAAGPGSTLSLPRAGQHSAHSRAHAHRFLLPQSGVFIGIETVIEIDIDRPFAPCLSSRDIASRLPSLRSILRLVFSAPLARSNFVSLAL